MKKIYSGRVCNWIVECPDTGERIVDIRAELSDTKKAARMPTKTAAEGAANWVSEITGRKFVSREAK